MRLLLVEDDRSVAGFVREGLEADRHDVEVVSDGGLGLELALKGDYGLILLDVGLPTKSGIEVCRTLREQGIRTPILMLTAKDSVEDKVKGLEIGADDYLTKPFALEELTARVKALLRRPSDRTGGPALKVADLELDADAHEVRRAGRLIPLTPKEFTLLEYLMRRTDRALSRSLIREQVWGSRQESLTNVVDVYIRRLRRKIDAGSARPLIHTVRGVGYQLKIAAAGKT